MTTEHVFERPMTTKRYPVRYSVWDYRFPQENAIEAVRFDETYIHVTLMDGRILSIPLDWIPPLRDATPAAREQYQISDDHTLLFWDPAESDINEILRISDYLTIRPARAG